MLVHKFEEIISVDNLLSAWQEFIRGKRNKKDVQEFAFGMMDNIFSLHYDLIHHTYKHGNYQQFRMNDPKPRIIHKASVRDKLLHHAVYHILYPYFDKVFIADSFSCRNNKGTHKAIYRFEQYKIFVKTLYSGIDFLGWVNFADHRILRTKTKNRMLKRTRRNPKIETLNSYLGLLGHGNIEKIKRKILG